MIKVKIASVEKIEDTAGEFGPQKRIVIKESLEGGDRFISGWISIKKFKEEDWKAGKTLDLIVTQSGKYWNFKLPNKTDQKIEEKNNEVMDALRKVYAKLVEVERKVDALNFESEPSRRAVNEDFP